MILLVIAISCFSLLFAVYLARYVIQREMGTERMQEISNAIKEGAEAFLSRQNRTIVLLAALLATAIELRHLDARPRLCSWLFGRRFPSFWELCAR